MRELSAGDVCRCYADMINAIWKIFSYAVWDSIRHLQLSRGYRCVYKLFASAKTKFLANACVSTNMVVRHLSFINVLNYNSSIYSGISVVLYCVLLLSGG